MKESKSIFWALSIKMIILWIIALVIGCFIVKDILAYIQGLFLGGIFTILKLRLMENTLKKVVEKEPRSAVTYAKMHYMLRYSLTLIVLFVGIVVPTINGIAVIIAMLIMKLAAFWQGLLEPKTPLDGSVEFYEWEEDEETDF